MTDVSAEEQQSLLQEAVRVIRNETGQMKRCLESRGRLMEALKHASNFLTELRTSQLTPKQYYELYILVYDSLDVLARFLREHHAGSYLADLYELVQYAGNIVPRLYLMITVGTVYMATPDAPVREVLKDMSEMCRGVQYPLRGLFLRYYLSQRTKDLLPAGPDSVQFIIGNFIEMNKLWVRLQHQGPSAERALRSQERDQLKVLVGSNLVRISQLETDSAYYKSYILPTILEQVVQCRDVLAQEYLLDVIIQVFPDEFHLGTLHEYLDCIPLLDPHVSLEKVLIVLIDRLTAYADREELDLAKLTLHDSQDLFEIFWNSLVSFEKSRHLTTHEVSLLLEALSRLSMTYYPRSFANLDLIFGFGLQKCAAQDPDHHDGFKSLLLIPLVSKLDNFFRILSLDNYLKLFQAESKPVQREISIAVLDMVLAKTVKIDTLSKLEILLEIFKNIITEKELETDLEQEKLGKLVHLVTSKSPENFFQLLKLCKKSFSEGHNVHFAYTSIYFQSLKLLRLKLQPEFNKDVFKFISRIINDLFRIGLTSKSFKLNLCVASIADQLNCEEVSYEFFAQAFTIYEESISDSKLQFQSIVSIIATLQQCRNFSKDNYDTLITKAALHGSKLLKKADQCRAVYLASHLWWGVEILAIGEEEGLTEFFRDDKRVLECLQRSLRVADACMDSTVSIELFVEILNRCLYYFIHGNNSITVKYINGLIELIKENLSQLKFDTAENPQKHFQRTLQYIQSQIEIDERFQLIQV